MATDTWDLDEDLDQADWTKTTWDFPAYKSKAFFEQVPPDHLDAFRKLPVYAAAVAQGLIYDDEWVADFVVPVDSTDKQGA